MKKKFVEVEGTIKVKIKKKFVAFLWGGTLLLAQDVVLIVVVMDALAGHAAVLRFCGGKQQGSLALNIEGSAMLYF